MKSKSYYIMILSLVMLSIGCSNDILKVSGSIPDVEEYEFYIEGEVGNRLLRYPQQNIERNKKINSYNIDNNSVSLMAAIDTLKVKTGQWLIGISNVDLNTIDLPYTLKEDEGSASWTDSRVDKIIEDTAKCHGADTNCSFVSESGENQITITSIKDNIIEGEFSGMFFLNRTGFSWQSYEDLYHEVTKGKFKIKLR